MTYLPTLEERIIEIAECDPYEAEQISRIIKREHELGSLSDEDFVQAVLLARLSLDEAA